MSRTIEYLNTMNTWDKVQAECWRLWRCCPDLLVVVLVAGGSSWLGWGGHNISWSWLHWTQPVQPGHWHHQHAVRSRPEGKLEQAGSADRELGSDSEGKEWLLVWLSPSLHVPLLQTVVANARTEIAAAEEATMLYILVFLCFVVRGIGYPIWYLAYMYHAVLILI